MDGTYLLAERRVGRSDQGASFGRNDRLDFGDVLVGSKHLDGRDDRLDPCVAAGYAELPTCIINAARMLNRHGAPTRIEASRAFARHVISAAISLLGGERSDDACEDDPCVAESPWMPASVAVKCGKFVPCRVLGR